MCFRKTPAANVNVLRNVNAVLVRTTSVEKGRAGAGGGTWLEDEDGVLGIDGDGSLFVDRCGD